MTKTPLASKLRIKPGNKVLLLNAPADIEQKFAQLPEGATLSKSVNGLFDIVLAFYTQKADLDKEVSTLKNACRRRNSLDLLS